MSYLLPPVRKPIVKPSLPGEEGVRLMPAPLTVSMAEVTSSDGQMKLLIFEKDRPKSVLERHQPCWSAGVGRLPSVLRSRLVSSLRKMASCSTYGSRNTSEPMHWASKKSRLLPGMAASWPGGSRL